MVGSKAKTKLRAPQWLPRAKRVFEPLYIVVLLLTYCSDQSSRK